MDHLPPVKNAYQPILVPDLGGEDYDGRDFFDYPAQHGWSAERLASASLCPETRLEVAQLLQVWLFHGLLSEVIGVKISRSHFFRTGTDGRKWVTTARLPEYVQEWNERAKSSTAEERLEKKMHSFNCLDIAGRAFRGRLGFSATDILTGEIELSILILVWTLDWCVVRIYGASSGGTDSNAESMANRAHSLLKPRLLENGWCPSFFGHMIRTVGPSGVYYASLFGPKSIRKDHSACSQDGCATDRLDDTAYMTKHAELGCTCTHVGPDIDRLNSILESGHIPLMSTDAGVLGVKVTPATPDRPYVAISHVWADGRGNCRGNSLPLCQVKLLEQHVHAALPVPLKDSEPVYFWMDTLCVPVKSETGRKTAIKQMHRVYAEAARVLVLDAELMLSTANSGAEEILTRIITSGWFLRLWTLQESALAQSLVFQFRERSVDANTLSETIGMTGTLENEIAYRAHSVFIQPWLIFKDKALSPIQRFCVVWQSLLGRSTSKAEDEPICVATLLGMRVDSLAETSAEERMQKFWSLHTVVPMSLLFVNGPKLCVDGYRWAPSTFLRRKRGRLLFWENGAAYCSSGRLSVKTSGLLLFSCNSKHLNCSSRFLRFMEKNSQIQYSMYMEPGDGNPSFREIGPDSLESPAVILRDGLSDRTIAPGVLVSSSRAEGHTIYAKYVGRVRIFKEGGAADKLWGLTGRFLAKDAFTAEAESTRENQEWCII